MESENRGLDWKGVFLAAVISTAALAMVAVMARCEMNRHDRNAERDIESRQLPFPGVGDN